MAGHGAMGRGAGSGISILGGMGVSGSLGGTSGRRGGVRPSGQERGRGRLKAAGAGRNARAIS